jgi:hypothetical protein
VEGKGVDMSKDRYLELSITKKLPERRIRNDRRSLITVLNPEVERRKRIRRKQETAKKEIERQKKEKSNFLWSIFLLAIPSSVFGWFGFKIACMIFNYIRIGLDKGFLF